MNSAGERPDPDQLLATVQAEETRARRGRLRIFFGASAGVGKTYAMLEAARVERAAGRDIVVGYVEPHGRHETERLMEGLEQLPVLPVRYRSTVRREFDLDAALQRRPEIILVDELAHSNLVEGEPAPRHAKRWQDIEELLDAGINVWTHSQCPAPREPQRSRRADHRGAATGDHPRSHIRRGRRSRADRPATG